MLGMLVLACADLSMLLRTADVAAAMSVEGLLGTDRAFAADLVALRPHPGQQVSAANLRTLLEGSPIVASHRTGDTRVQDAYSLRCAPQVHGAARDALSFAETCADRELASAIDNPVVLGRWPRRVGRQLPRRAAGLRVRSAGHRHRRRRRHERAAHRSLPRRVAQPRPAAVPRARARRRQRADDRPVHGGRAGGRVQAPRRSRQRRLHPDLGHAGRPRLDGLGGRPQAAHRARSRGQGAGHRARHRGARHRPARPLLLRRAAPARPATRFATAACPDQGQTGSSRPSSKPPRNSSSTARSSPRSSRRWARLAEGARVVRPRGRAAQLQGLGPRGRAAHVDEQPRP